MGDLKHVKGRVIVSANKSQKNHVTFKDGTVLKLERDYNNLDRAYTQQTMGVVVDAEKMPSGALVLFHFNALHDTYKIFNHSELSGEQIASGDEVFSILENQCYLWKMPGDFTWNPCTIYQTALRVFEPYKGVLDGIPPKRIKDTLYVTSGNFKGKVVKTLKSCDAVIIFRNEKGVDEEIIRFRPDGDDENHREPEAIAILNDFTEKVNNGDLLVGLTESNCKSLNEVYA